MTPHTIAISLTPHHHYDIFVGQETSRKRPRTRRLDEVDGIVLLIFLGFFNKPAHVALLAGHRLLRYFLSRLRTLTCSTGIRRYGTWLDVIDRESCRFFFYFFSHKMIYQNEIPVDVELKP